MNKVLYIPAYFAPVGKEKKEKVITGEKKKGFFGVERNIIKKESKWKQTGWSNCKVDGKRLAEDLSSAVRSLNQEGFEVVSVTPISSGTYGYDGAVPFIEGEDGYGYGYSYTSSLIVTAKKYV